MENVLVFSYTFLHSSSLILCVWLSFSFCLSPTLFTLVLRIPRPFCTKWFFLLWKYFNLILPFYISPFSFVLPPPIVLNVFLSVFFHFFMLGFFSSSSPHTFQHIKPFRNGNNQTRTCVWEINDEKTTKRTGNNWKKRRRRRRRWRRGKRKG